MPDYTDGIIHIEYAHTANAADNLMTQTVAIETTLDNLEMELQALITWLGEDKIEYETQQKRWDSAVRAMGQILKDNSHLLEEIAANYKRNEQRLADAFRDLPI
ncbi:WXG100 family type VII secretion target [Streptomyces sp. NPDC094143]|uniref:WXG100 family type VII secretion target n=1 Tax=Streptomyces sp. NPDC094143 TaxID=3155310 RepID=UPI003324C09F